MQKLLHLKITKAYNECRIEVDPSSVANTDIAFKDICITLRSSQNLFESNSNGFGNCEIFIYNKSAESDITMLGKEELIHRIKFYSENLIEQRAYLQRTAIFKHLDKVEGELAALYKSILALETKDQILERYEDKIQFYNNQLFPTMLSSKEVEIAQDGFQFEELKSLLAGIYKQFRAKYSFIYDVDFNTLVFK